MKARKLLEGSVTFDAEQLAVVTRAFDRAWSEIVHRIPDDQRDGARERLAMIIIEIAGNGMTDEEQLRLRALETLAHPLN